MQSETLHMLLFVVVILLMFNNQSWNDPSRRPPYHPYHRWRSRPPILYDYHDHPFYRFPENSNAPYYLPWDADERGQAPEGPGTQTSVVLIILAALIVLAVAGRMSL